jgi:hypothetical protein
MAYFIPLLPLQASRYVQTNCQSYRSRKMKHVDKVVNVYLVKQQEREKHLTAAKNTHRKREKRKEKNAIG